MNYGRNNTCIEKILVKSVSEPPRDNTGILILYGMEDHTEENKGNKEAEQQVG